jgi:hypothetical protein
VLTPLVQVTWLGLSAAVFVIWVWMLCRLLLVLGRNARLSAATAGIDWPGNTHHNRGLTVALRVTLGRLIALMAILLILNALGLLIWPP